MDETTKKLHEYISQEFSKGVSKDNIKQALLNVGWRSDQVNKVFLELESKVQSPKSETGIPNQEQTDQSHTPIVNQDDHVVVGTESEASQKQKGRKLPKWGLIILVLLLLVAVGGAVYGYFYYYLAPERILAESAETMKQVGTYDYSGSIILKISGDLYASDELGSEYDIFSLFTPREFSTTFSGSVDTKDENNIKTNSTFSVEMNSVELAEMQMLALGEVFYIKLNNLNTFGLFPVDRYLNKWLFINMEELSEVYDLDYEVQEEQQLSEEDEMRITNSFAEHQPLEITEKLDNEERSGVDTFHFKYSIDKEQLKLFLRDVSDILKKYPQSEDVDVDELTKILDGIEFYDGDLWIGSDDYYLYGFTGGMSTEIPDSDATMEIAINMDMDRFNEPKNIIAPTDYKTFEEFNQMLMEDMTELYSATDSGALEGDVQEGDMSNFLRALQSTQPDVSGMSDER